MTVFSYIYLMVVSVSLGIAYLIGKPAPTADRQQQSGKGEKHPVNGEKRPSDATGAAI